MSTAASGPKLTEQDIKKLTEAAGLALKPGREGVVLAILNPWLSDAHELNRKMSARQYWGLTPIAVFTHGRA